MAIRDERTGRGAEGRRSAFVLVALAAGCGSPPALDANGAAGERSIGIRSAIAGRPMSRGDAERYMLDLINRDRAAQGLSALPWDETAARAARRQAEDMAARGFTAHWGSDGSVPEQRYTEAGGEDVAFENVGCFVDASASPLALDAPYMAEGLDRFQRAFMDEEPPHDGHRRNILSRWHTAVGVGVAQVEGSRIPCVAQEFVDDWGTYEHLPPKISVGDFVDIRGELRAPAELAIVGISRIDAPGPRAPQDLNQTSDYLVPEAYEAYLPRRLKTPFPRPRGVLSLLGSTFSLGTYLDDEGKPGLYEISIWARFPGVNEERLVSLRTIDVGSRAP
ncbi:CAP domain-containing protein [Polyangium sorediatum]|uniref:CAP domain-containing protein n=1 Tax=Polyangium sorediatum TaxID=889274 RepID=A0ABT6NVR2_9BACT|nr:CAP domain-containing protein [Polyangium sorediatum]MDI1432419.1 CAP domain-containing protein [Polyangium sorediatum]